MTQHRPETAAAEAPAHPIPLPRISAIAFPMLPPLPEQGRGPNPDLTRLNLNESPYPPSPHALAAAQTALIWANRYPDHHCTELAAEISARTGVAPDCISFGNGSGELLVQTALIALQPGDEAVMPSPTFPTCGKGVQMAGARIVNVALRADGVNDVPAMLAAITPRTRLFYLCTPNNPTGGALTAAELSLAIAAVPDTCLLVIDEAYHEFALREGGAKLLPLLAGRRGPWVVSRTFSKAYCMAGLRVGYLLCSSAALTLGFTRIRHNFNVSRPSLAAAVAALRDDAHMTATTDKIIAERAYLAGQLARLGASHLPSAANFLTIRSPRPAADIVAALARAHIAVQALAWPDALGAVRITIGTRADSDRLLAVLQALATQTA